MSTSMFLVLGLCAFSALAHELNHEVGQAQAIVIRMTYGDSAPFAFEAYEIYPEGGKLPAQVGRTDAQGRIAFLPPQAGRWRVKTWSEDGHGLEFTFETEAGAQPEALDRPLYERHGRILAGVALILGLFGLLSLFLRRRKS